jgi:tellurite resistance protein
MIQVEVLRAACCVAGADGETTPAERVLLDKLAKQTGVGLASLEAMIDRACSDPAFCNEQFKILKAEPKDAMAILLDIAMADGNVDAAELQALSVFAKRLSVPEEIFQKLANTAKQMADDRRQS